MGQVTFEELQGLSLWLPDTIVLVSVLIMKSNFIFWKCSLSGVKDSSPKLREVLRWVCRVGGRGRGMRLEMQREIEMEREAWPGLSLRTSRSSLNPAAHSTSSLLLSTGLLWQQSHNGLGGEGRVGVPLERQIVLVFISFYFPFFQKYWQYYLRNKIKKEVGGN